MWHSLHSDAIIMDHNYTVLAEADENSLSLSRPVDNSNPSFNYMGPIVDKVFNHIISSPEEKNKFMKKVDRRGMGNHGRPSKNRNILPKHVGPVPGIEVGSCWQFRWLVSRAGVHGPHMAGIDRNGGIGASSIVVSGVYSEDKDYGDEFLYSGCGGKENYKNKRFSRQIMDQKLTGYNLSLAVCCNAELNDKEGAEAVDWQGGKPVRVIRSHTLKSMFAPAEGFRYDGIYKVVKYYPTRGDTGLLVWQYLMRRDDPVPAPWTKEGQERIHQLNLTKMIRATEEKGANWLKKNRINTELIKCVKQKKSSIVKKTKKRRECDPTFQAVSKTCSRLERWYPTRRLTIRFDSPQIPQTHQAPPASDYNCDIKPDVVQLTREVMNDLPWTSNRSHDLTPVEDPYIFFGQEDVKPNIRLLPKMTFDQPISSRYDTSGIGWSLNQVPVISAVTTSHVEFEDVKPDINELNALIAINGASLLSDNSPEKPTEGAAVYLSPKFTPSNVPNGVACNAEPFVPLQSMDISTFKISNTSSPMTNDKIVGHHMIKEEPSTQDTRSDEFRLPLKKRASSKELPHSESVSTLKIKISKVSSLAESENKLPLTLNSNTILNSIDMSRFKFPTKMQNLMEKDALNKGLWDYLSSSRIEEKFINRVKMNLSCPCCKRIVPKLVTTPCSHSICHDCMHHHFKKNVYSCPKCHNLLGHDFLLRYDVQY